ncbi:hypothetical protein [Paraburkholderia youngii]|uniref:hypothetical protein n=1 Tax=Paraburkholderia youngii TaxID=2782701 RepID=UPI003D19C595
MSDDKSRDVENVEEAEAIGANFASVHGVSEREARGQARTWFENGEGFPQRKYDALERALKRHFGLF